MCLTFSSFVGCEPVRGAGGAGCVCVSGGRCRGSGCVCGSGERCRGSGARMCVRWAVPGERGAYVGQVSGAEGAVPVWRRRGRRVCQVGDLFGLNTGRGTCRGPCRRVPQLRLGEPQCLGRHLQIVRVSDPHLCRRTYHGRGRGRDHGSDRTGLRPGTRRASAALCSKDCADIH
jgi:hypothetical protein